MASALDSTDVLGLVRTLRDDSGMQALRDDVRRRHQQHAMTDVPWLPDHLTRGITAVLPSVEPAFLAQVINADMSSYITQTTVIPGSPDLQAKADKVEKRYALERAELFTNRNRARIRWSQMIRGYGVYKLVCGAVKDKHPWSLSLPDPLSCFFTLTGNLRPPLMGREYEVLVRDIVHGKAYKDVRQGRQPVYKDGVWDWEKLSEDINIEDTQYQQATAKAMMERVRVCELDSGTTTYCLALNRDGQASDAKTPGQIVWERPNLTGGTAYVIVPGHMTDSREPREAILPYLWSSMNVANQIQLVDTIRMTRSLNVKPQVLIERTPELLKAAQELGIARPVTETQQPIEGDTLLEVNGTPYFWQVPEDRDLEALESRLEQRLARYSSAQLDLTTGEVLKNITVRGLQLALGARKRQQGPMLQFEDEAEAEILRMWKHSITCEGGYGADEWGLHAKAPELYSKGEMSQGEYSAITKADLLFDHDVDVTTTSLTREEKSLDVDAWAARHAAGLSTLPEGLDASGYTNREEQQLELTKEEGYKMAAMLAGPNLASRIFEARMRERAGVWIQGVDTSYPPGPPANPKVQNGNDFNVPRTEQVGGSVQPEVTEQPL